MDRCNTARRLSGVRRLHRAISGRARRRGTGEGGSWGNEPGGDLQGSTLAVIYADDFPKRSARWRYMAHPRRATEKPRFGGWQVPVVRPEAIRG